MFYKIRQFICNYKLLTNITGNEYGFLLNINVFSVKFSQSVTLYVNHKTALFYKTFEYKSFMKICIFWIP